MSRETIGYVQKRDGKTGEWDMIPLYTAKHEVACIWRNGEAYDTLSDYCYVPTTAEKTAINDFLDIENDCEAPAWKAINLSNLKYLAIAPAANVVLDTEEEYMDARVTFKSLKDELETYTRLAEEYIISDDTLRLIYYLSY